MAQWQRHKDEVITFKVDPDLAEVLHLMPNRSQFIRAAVLSALGHVCPLCQGLGILSPDQKQHWQKFTAWRAVTRVPLMIRVPRGVAPGLMQGTPAGSVCTQPVNLLDLFPTLTDLARLPPKPDNYGHSLVPLLSDSAAS